MLMPFFRSRLTLLATSLPLAALALAFFAHAQQPPAQPTPDAAQQPATPATQATLSPAQKTATGPDDNPFTNINQIALERLLAGKTFYLRGGYLGDTLGFDEHGRFAGHSPQGSYTLNVIQIEKIRLSKHKVELIGIRYGQHFTAQLATENSSKTYDQIRITPPKKAVRITIDREIVVTPKTKKDPKAEQGKGKEQSKITSWKARLASLAKPAPPGPEPVEPPATSAPQSPELNQELRTYVSIGPNTERPADYQSVTTTTSPAHAASVFKEALDNIFAPSLDERMMASMPDFWKLYYQAVAAKTDYRPKDPSILRQNTVDQKAVLLSKFAPESNEYAQNYGIAGMAQYHVIIGADGKAGEIAISRPIGFGLDENAVAAIRAASFQPAIFDGKPVPVMLDLDVPFRIFSKRTNIHSSPDSTDKTGEPILPGPYSLPR